MDEVTRRIQHQFHNHGKLFAKASRAIEAGDEDSLIAISERMLGDGRMTIQYLYDLMEEGEFNLVRHSIGPAVRAWREAAKINQNEVASLIMSNNLSLYERGLKTPNLETALRLAIAVLLASSSKQPLHIPYRDSRFNKVASQLKEA